MIDGEEQFPEPGIRIDVLGLYVNVQYHLPSRLRNMWYRWKFRNASTERYSYDAAKGEGPGGTRPLCDILEREADVG